MEMCYDGALVMPNSYAVMSDDEMMYLVGGKPWTVDKTARAIDIAVSVILAAVGVGLGVGSIVWALKNNVKGLVVYSLSRAISSLVIPLGFSIGSGLYSILTVINPNWTIGKGIANYIDRHEKGKKRGNGLVGA